MRLQRVRAWVALTAFAAALALPLVAVDHLALDDDAACGSVALRFGPDRPTLGPATAPGTEGHCALCHWLRAVSGVRIGAAIVISSWLEPIESRPVSQPLWSGAIVVPEGPSRAPPVHV